MLEAIITEIDLCQRLGETELADVFQAEKDKIEKQNLSCGPAALVCFKNVYIKFPDQFEVAIDPFVDLGVLTLACFQAHGICLSQLCILCFLQKNRSLFDCLMFRKIVEIAIIGTYPFVA